MALGIWIGMPYLDGSDDLGMRWVAFVSGVLGGVALVGPPLLLWNRWRGPIPAARARLGPGRLLWFTSGVVTWLDWPPIIAFRFRNPKSTAINSMAEVCFVYGTPAMGLFMWLGLWGSGWLRGKTRRR